MQYEDKGSPDSNTFMKTFVTCFYLIVKYIKKLNPQNNTGN